MPDPKDAATTQSEAEWLSEMRAETEAIRAETEAIRAKTQSCRQQTDSLLKQASELKQQNEQLSRQNSELYDSLISSLRTNHSPRRYIAHYIDGRRMELEAVSRDAALLAARELFGPGLVRVMPAGQW
jgi:uncharacterized coiled-coil DUF342 family protein